MRDSGGSLPGRAATLEALGFRRVESSAPPADTVPVANGRYKVTARRPSMGTLVSVTGIHPSANLVQEAAGLAFQEMDRLVLLLNRYDPGSALSVLNANGVMRGPPPELLTVVREARSHFNFSRGAFDPTVKPLVDLLRDEGGSGPPPEARLRDALARVDGTRLEVSPRSVRLGLPGMELTLDGIAKGFIVDRMAEILDAQGLQDFLIDGGGDIRCAGVREDGQPWRVGVQDPGKRGDLPDVIGLPTGAVATSGSYESFFDPDRRHHHLINAGFGSRAHAGPLSDQLADPCSRPDHGVGLSPQTCVSVSVVAPTAMAADALATSVFVMGPKQGVKFIDRFSRCACFVIDREGRQFKSRKWRNWRASPTGGGSSTDLPVGPGDSALTDLNGEDHSTPPTRRQG